MATPLFEVAAPSETDPSPAITLHTQLHAGAGKAELTGFAASAVMLRVAAPAASPAGNRATRDVVAELFGVPTEAVTVVAGERGTAKQLRVSGVGEAEATRLIELARHRLADSGSAGGRIKRGH